MMVMASVPLSKVGHCEVRVDGELKVLEGGDEEEKQNIQAPRDVTYLSFGCPFRRLHTR